MENFFKESEKLGLSYAPNWAEFLTVSSYVLYFSKPRIFPDLCIEKLTVRREYINYKAYR